MNLPKLALPHPDAVTGVLSQLLLRFARPAW
jgi:hypothetical protein